MSNRALGVFCCILAAFLWFYAIPTWVSAPSNVSKVVLSPTFWPLIISVLIGLSGAYLLITEAVQTSDDGVILEQPDSRGAGFARLGLASLAMLAFLVSVETVGLVIGSMVLFLVIAIIITQAISWRFILIAICLPIALYGFFAHVASVAIPQGEWIQLP
jgi:putative tricarboxylic transport membrane protein